MTEEAECIVCKKQAKMIFKNFSGYVEGELFNIYYCGCCNTSFVWPHAVDDKIYDKIYSQSKIVPGYNRYELYAHSITKKKKALEYLADKEAMYFAVNQILSENNDPAKKILEVGSGLGYLTYAVAQKGYDIIGLDISVDAIKKSKKRFGKNYVCEDVYKYAIENNQKFNLIILTEVIEHVPDPYSFCNGLINLLKPKGRLIISTPNKSAFPQQEYWNTELPPVHLTWFSEKSFKVLSERLGLSLSFFDFTEFNKKHFDFTKYRYYENYKKRHKRVPTLNIRGEVLEPKTLITNNTLSKLKNYIKIFIKSIMERMIILSPLVDKKNMDRSAFLCVIFQKG